MQTYQIIELASGKALFIRSSGHVETVECPAKAIRWLKQHARSVGSTLPVRMVEYDHRNGTYLSPTNATIYPEDNRRFVVSVRNQEVTLLDADSGSRLGRPIQLRSDVESQDIFDAVQRSLWDFEVKA